MKKKLLFIAIIVLLILILSKPTAVAIEIYKYMPY